MKIKRGTIIALVAVALFGALLLFNTLSAQKAECNVCVEFNGKRNCATASHENQEEATRSAQNTACGVLASGMPSIEMPGHTMPGFREIADVIRRAGIYGPRDYLRIVQEQIQYWKIETLTGLGEMGRRAQEKIAGIPDRLRRIAEHIESRTKSKTFAFDVVFNREFAME